MKTSSGRERKEESTPDHGKNGRGIETQMRNNCQNAEDTRRCVSCGKRI